MKCDKASELISLYIDKELNRQDEQLLMEHLSECDDCRNEYEQLKVMVEELNNIPLVELPNGYHSELILKIENTKVDNAENISYFKPKENNQNNNKKTNWKKYSAIAAALFILVVVGSGLGGNSKRGTKEQSADQKYSESAAPAAEDIDASPRDINVDGAAFDEASGESKEVSTISNKLNLSNSQNNERMKIKRLYAGLEVKDFDEAITKLKEITEANGGYVENYTSYVYNYDDTNGISLKQGDITLRMPKESYEASKNLLNEIGSITDENETTEDVTAEYIDTQGRLNMKLKEEERLLELIDKSNTIEDIIKIESRLGEVRADIESYTTSIQNWDRLVQFSTITLNIVEVTDSKITSIDSDFGSKIQNSFIYSINIMSMLGQNTVIALAGLFIPILIIAFIAFCAVNIKKKKKKDVKKNDK